MLIRSIRTLSQPFLRRNFAKSLQPVRNSSVMHYRLPAPKSAPYTFIAADALNAFMWWWIFVHCYYQWGHVVGEHDFPVPEKWTDAELGVVDIDVDE